MKVVIDFSNSPSVTVQSAAAECDIHNILNRYKKTGVLPNVRGGYYDDVTAAMDFQRSMEVVTRAQQAFAELSASERAKYDNDVQKWMVATVENATVGGAGAPIAPVSEDIESPVGDAKASPLKENGASPSGDGE